MSTSPEDPPTESGAPDSAATEPLACTSCRSRKLKCDRHKPICTRCAKVDGECVYPESRRKPAFKRRNVKELEERLAQVEGFLKNAGKPAGADAFGDGPERAGDPPSTTSPVTEQDPELNDLFFTNGFTNNPQDSNPPPAFSSQRQDNPLNFSSRGSDGSGFGQTGSELFGLGRFESLPPFKMIEDLHNIFFEAQQSFIPLVNRNRYAQAFYATAPHMRPPMCLQYAMWAMAANGHEKYSRYYDIFYRRARQYLENDELKGYGEHFVTLAHAQAWALIGTNEARCMHFTKASMSSARCVRLVEMMGFHRLDDPCKEDNPIAPTIDPPKDLVELEERRRVFWGAFCMDAHASISTGWPTLVDLSQVTTRLPCSEDAFNSGRDEKAPTLKSVFEGCQYSTFAATVVTCHIFTQLLKHVHRPLPDDCPEDYQRGKYWKRHRELDNILSSSFMFLPERFRLPKYCRDPVAIFQNLNLHASVICLHNSACDKVDKFKLPSHIKEASQMRCLTAAYEVVNIMKMTSHVGARYKTPLVALSLYCAASVFVSRAKEDSETGAIDNLLFLVTCMEAIGRQHVITRAYLNHLVLDIQCSGIDIQHKLTLLSTTEIHAGCGYNIPLLARSSASVHSPPQPPPPLSRPLLPLKPSGACPFALEIEKEGFEAAATDNPAVDFADTDAPGSKRKRTSGPSNASKSPKGGDAAPLFCAQKVFEPTDQSSAPKQPIPNLDFTAGAGTDFWANLVGSGGGGGGGSARPVRLPHRSNTPSATTPSSETTNSGPANTTQESMLRFAMMGMGSSEFMFERTVAPAELLSTTATATRDTTAGDMMADSPNPFQGMDQWDGIVDPQLFSQMAAALLLQNSGSNSAEGFSPPEDDSDPWTQLLNGAGGSWDTRGGGGGE